MNNSFEESFLPETFLGQFRLAYLQIPFNMISAKFAYSFYNPDPHNLFAHMRKILAMFSVKT